VFDIPDDIDVSDELTKDEIPVTRDKNLKKAKKLVIPNRRFS